MTIVNQQLHPENDPDTIIHPETSPSQAGVALYEHRVRISASSNDRCEIACDIINTQDTLFTLGTLVEYTEEKHISCFGNIYKGDESKIYQAFSVNFNKQPDNSVFVNISYYADNLFTSSLMSFNSSTNPISIRDTIKKII